MILCITPYGRQYLRCDRERPSRSDWVTLINQLPWPRSFAKERDFLLQQQQHLPVPGMEHAFNYNSEESIMCDLVVYVHQILKWGDSNDRRWWSSYKSTNSLGSLLNTLWHSLYLNESLDKHDQLPLVLHSVVEEQTHLEEQLR